MPPFKIISLENNLQARLFSNPPTTITNRPIPQTSQQHPPCDAPPRGIIVRIYTANRFLCSKKAEPFGTSALFVFAYILFENLCVGFRYILPYIPNSAAYRFADSCGSPTLRFFSVIIALCNINNEYKCIVKTLSLITYKIFSV